MKCARIQDLLKSDYLDAQLDERLLLQVETHLKSCPTCKELKKELECQRTAMRQIKHQEVPAQIWQNIKNAIIQEQLKEPNGIFEHIREKLKRVFCMPRPAFALVGTAAVIIMALTAVKLITGNYQPLSKTDGEDSWAAYRINGDTYTYNLGTAIEEYFL